jgi:branched-chain amino acid aminotransferase
LLSGTILHGTTRQALIELLHDMGVEVQERLIPIEEIFAAHSKGLLQEAFGAGTAATVAPIGRIGHDGSVPALEGYPEIILPPVDQLKIAPELLKRLTNIRVGREADLHGWVVPV